MQTNFLRIWQINSSNHKKHKKREFLSETTQLWETVRDFQYFFVLFVIRIHTSICFCTVCATNGKSYRISLFFKFITHYMFWMASKVKVIDILKTLVFICEQRVQLFNWWCSPSIPSKVYTTVMVLKAIFVLMSDK